MERSGGGSEAAWNEGRKEGTIKSNFKQIPNYFYLDQFDLFNFPKTSSNVRSNHIRERSEGSEAGRVTSGGWSEAGAGAKRRGMRDERKELSNQILKLFIFFFL